MSRPFGPKPADHPSVGNPCPACHAKFRAGDWTALVPIGPGDDAEAQEAVRNGHAYTAIAIEAHWTCVTGEVIDDDQ